MPVIDVVTPHDASVGMPIAPWNFDDRHACVVGSVGDSRFLTTLDAASAAVACDMVELRLDLYGERVTPSAWAHLRAIPLLMTARREDEGGAKGVNGALLLELLEMALPDAALVDVEVASIPVAAGLIRKLADSSIPWVASFHNFERTPELEELREKAAIARDAGAAAFKAASLIQSPSDLAQLANFQLEDHGIAVATMGMGAMAAVSRLLCAQCGSVLNYGFLGETPTAPGQWSAAEMKSALGRLQAIR